LNILSFIASNLLLNKLDSLFGAYLKTGLKSKPTIWLSKMQVTFSNAKASLALHLLGPVIPGPALQNFYTFP
jgi:hypothetical protein